MIDYQKRRLDLAAKLPVDALALIPSASECLRSGDSHYRFRQDSDFYYLTGFNEPDALLVIINTAPVKVILFHRPHNPLEELWNGPRMGTEDSPRLLQIDEAYSNSAVESKLPEIFMAKQAIYYAFDRFPVWEQIFIRAWQKLNQSRISHRPLSFCHLTPLIAELRVIKSADEIDLMRQAARLSVKAHQRVMTRVKDAHYEYELEAEFLYELNRNACRNLAYDSIVAGGKSACILHYTQNTQVLRDEDMVLIDAGGEWESYAADITRTYPIRGRFSEAQRAIYNLVYEAQLAAIALIQPQVLWTDIQKRIVEILTAGLVDLGILQGSVSDLIAREAYKPFYMHQSGHWLGLDVHDPGEYRRSGHSVALQENMVLTIEPGLYFPAERLGQDHRFAGIGVRIEDDIRVTRDGYENLTAELVKAPDDLEQLIRG